MGVNWHNLTVFQFQQLSALWQEAKDKEEIDLAAESVAICFGLTLNQVDSFTVPELKEKYKELSFLNNLPQWEPQKFFETEGRRYRFVYDVRQIHAARYMEVKQFSASGMVEGIHKMAASMVIPQRRNWRRQWVDAPYDAGQHEAYAQDVLAAPITDIYGSAVFFCKLFAHSIEALQDYLTKEIPMEKREEARQLLQTSIDSLAGSTQQHSLPNMSGSHLSRRIRSRLSNSSTA